MIGESKDYSGKPNKIQHAIEEFVGLLTFEVMIPIEYCDERLSSAGAARVSPRRKDTHSLARGAKRPNAQHKAANLDASAAALILQSYLDSH